MSLLNTLGYEYVWVFRWWLYGVIELIVASARLALFQYFLGFFSITLRNIPTKFTRSKTIPFCDCICSKILGTCPCQDFHYSLHAQALECQPL